MNLRWAAGALVVAACLGTSACSGSDSTLVYDAVEPGASASASSSTPTATSPTATATPSATTPAAAPASGTRSGTQTVPAELTAVRRLRTLATAGWQSTTDGRTGVSFSLPRVVAERKVTQNGVAQRLYSYAMTAKTGVSVGFVRTPSPAAAKALLPIYPQQLQQSFAAVGADDAAVSEQRTTSIGGAPAVMFRFSFTPTAVPQIPPVWLATVVAVGADIVLLQTIAFPRSLDYDYLAPLRQVQQRLVASLDLP